MNEAAPEPRTPEPGAGAPTVAAQQPAPAVAASRSLAIVVAVLALVLAAMSLAINVTLWERLSSARQQLARQSGESSTQAVEARTIAQQAQDLARDAAARAGVLELRLSEVSVQRGQLEDLIQSLSRTRDQNLAVDLESALRFAQQQAELTGSVQPLLAALRSTEQRVARAAQPQLAPVQRALARDITRITGTAVSDTPAMLSRIDELLRLADELPLVNAVAAVSASGTLQRKEDGSVPTWWSRALQVLGEEVRGLVRVSHIERPEAMLLSPEQSFFVRENFKLTLLNARLGLLARQKDAARADVASASSALFRYFDPASRRTQAAAGVLQQLQLQMKALEIPRIDETLSALSTAAAGR